MGVAERLCPSVTMLTPVKGSVLTDNPNYCTKAYSRVVITLGILLALASLTIHIIINNQSMIIINS